jgi:uncharacterized protein YndB with AHSA1/START domain
VYVISIRTTAARLWEALLDPEVSRRYWLGMRTDAEWKPGGSWKLVYPDGRVADAGEVTELEPQTLIKIRTRNEWPPEAKAGGWAHCTIHLEPQGDAVKLPVSHEHDRPTPEFLEAASSGWPMILSNLKSLLETGRIAVGRES